VFGAGWRCEVMAMEQSEWQIQIHFEEDDTHTHATATAQLRGEQALTGRGDAYRHPNDRNLPVVGEEIAAARALIELTSQLLHAATAEIERVTHQPAHLSG
jgi:Domain of unknown function (DUF1876)